MNELHHQFEKELQKTLSPDQYVFYQLNKPTQNVDLFNAAAIQSELNTALLNVPVVLNNLITEYAASGYNFIQFPLNLLSFSQNLGIPALNLAEIRSSSIDKVVWLHESEDCLSIDQDRTFPRFYSLVWEVNGFMGNCKYQARIRTDEFGQQEIRYHLFTNQYCFPATMANVVAFLFAENLFVEFSDYQNQNPLIETGKQIQCRCEGIKTYLHKIALQFLPAETKKQIRLAFMKTSSSCLSSKESPPFIDSSKLHLFEHVVTSESVVVESISSKLLQSYHLLSTQGFMVCKLSSSIQELLSSLLENNCAEIRQQIRDQLASSLCHLLPCYRRIIPVDSIVRDSSEQSRFQPISLAHIDFVTQDIPTLIDIFQWKVSSEDRKLITENQDKYTMINVWIPLKHGATFPLLVLDKRSLSESEKSPYWAQRQNKQHFQALGIKYACTQRWVLPRLLDKQDAIVFETFQAGHAAYKMNNEFARMSIEIRCIVDKIRIGVLHEFQ